LVLFQLFLSLILLTWAVATFLSPVDWGRREASKAWYDPPEGKQTPVNERIAAHIDERIAGYEKYVENKRQALQRYIQVEQRFAKYEGKFADYHLDYVAILERLDGVKLGDGITKAAPVKATDFNAVKYAPNGVLVLNPPLPWGQLVRDTPVPGKKSYVDYLRDLEAKMKEIHGVIEKIDDLVKKKTVITERLNGKMEKGKRVPGLYHLIEGEASAQRKLRDELGYLEPLWVRELFSAAQMGTRRDGLEARLKELGEQPPPTILP
jgi:hypothetical protein